MKLKTKEIENELKVLKNLVKWFKDRIEPEDCGWMHTTIDGLRFRMKVLRSELQTRKKSQEFTEQHWSDYL